MGNKHDSRNKGNSTGTSNSDENWGFGRDNRVGRNSYDWGSGEYGSRDINDRNFGREWDKGSSLMPPQRNDLNNKSFNSDSRYSQAPDSGLETGGNHAGRGPKNYRRSDDRIKEDASDVLERHPDIDASEIELEVKEGIIFLRGTVEDRRTKRMAEDAVEHISGVKDIHNELTLNKSIFERAKEMLVGKQTGGQSGDSTGDQSASSNRNRSLKRSKSRH
jgi:hypothetical protein